MTSQLVLGAGGLLGTGIINAASSLRGVNLVSLKQQIPWSNPAATQEMLNGAVSQFLTQYGDEPWRLIWAAGIGRVGAPARELAAEGQALATVCNALAAADPATAERGQLVFASSAGAIFAGHGPGIIDTDSAPAPTADYGRYKLAQEAVVAQLAAATQMRVLICRYSNLFGIRGDGSLGAGLVSAAIRSALQRIPLQIFVTPDNRRDYLYNLDAGTLTLHAARASDAALPGLTYRLICSGQTRTVTEVIQTVGRVLGAKVPVVYGITRETALQPQVLQFKSPDGPRPGLTLFPTAVAATGSAHRVFLDSAAS